MPDFSTYDPESEICPYDGLPLKPLLEEDGDRKAWHGYPMDCCKNGHWFVQMPCKADRDALEQIVTQAA